MGVKPIVSDQRKSVRCPAFMSGHLLDPSKGVLVDCQVRDFSSGGARITLRQPFALPSVFWLKLQGDGRMLYCTVKWQSEQQFGVEFTRDKLLKIAEKKLEALRGRWGRDNAWD